MTKAENTFRDNKWNEAMQIHAIEFATWIADMNYVQLRNERWCLGDLTDKKDRILYSSEDLYELFNNEK